MKFLITTGGTRVPIDDVRHIGNSASGAYGHMIYMQAAVKHPASILFRDSHNHYEWEYFEERSGITPKEVIYKDYHEYLRVKALISKERPDIIISTAAVSDYVVDKTEGKISSDQDEIVIKLKKAEKVLCSFRELAGPNTIIVGFKLLVSPTEIEKEAAIIKQFDCAGVDFVVYNDLTELRKGNTTRYVYDKYLNVTPIRYPKQLIEFLETEYKLRTEV